MKYRVSLAFLGLALASCAPTSEMANVAPPPPHAAPAELAETVAPTAQTEVAGLPEGPGRETTLRVCSGCHAVELVMDKKMTRQEWFDTVQFMGDRGAAGTPAEFAEITDYLARNFPKT